MSTHAQQQDVDFNKVREDGRQTSPSPSVRNQRRIPLLAGKRSRTALGLALLVVSAVVAQAITGQEAMLILLAVLVPCWGISMSLTEKYNHKYPQRYFTYWAASHGKAAIIMVMTASLLGLLIGADWLPFNLLLLTAGLFIALDALLSLPWRSESPRRFTGIVEPITQHPTAVQTEDGQVNEEAWPSVDAKQLVTSLGGQVEPRLVQFVESNLQGDVRVQSGADKVLVLNDVTKGAYTAPEQPAALLVSQRRINDIHRLNRFFNFCVEQIAMGGYFVVSYTPLENVTENLKKRYKGPLFPIVNFFYFIWYRGLPKIPFLDRLYFSHGFSWLDSLLLLVTKKRNRLLSKAELWGRLFYHGMHVVAETSGEGELLLIARRMELPNPNKRPSYYPVVALKKVALDGKTIRTHKLRTMFPFSEFLQKRIFEDHGLTSTGKFSNDFRLTSVGKFLRKYWLDELPQIFDWLRGDIKLVGIRATSHHFLSLYPNDFLELYVDTKPGLIPPIFDANTDGFDDIVKVELDYLEAYHKAPLITDVQYFFRTFNDIFIRGVRSK